MSCRPVKTLHRISFVSLVCAVAADEIRDEYHHSGMCDVYSDPHCMESTDTERCNCRSQGKRICHFNTIEADKEQLFTVGVHELFHLAVGLLCGGQVVSICIDPNDGGATHVLGLMRDYPRVMNDPYAMPTFTQLFWSPSAVATLAAGYVGSAVVGFVLVVSAGTVAGADLIVLLLFVTC
jgi:hypothetical protein